MANAAFDPDKFLAEVGGGAVAQGGLRTSEPLNSFDPDKFLSEVSKSGQLTPSEKMEMAMNPSATPKAMLDKGLVEHGANGLLMGYLPQAVGGAKSLVGQDYIKSRDTVAQRLDAEAAENPGSAMVGELVGGAAGGMLTPEIKALKGMGFFGGLVKGGLYGGAYGAASNPGDTEGKMGGMQLQDRLENAKKGTLIGGAAGAASGTTLKALAGAKDVAETQAVKASGAMLKDFRAKGDKVNDLGRYALDNGIVKAGDTFETIKGRASQAVKEAGQRLNNLYQKAVEAIKDPAIAESMPGFNPARDKAQILSDLSDNLKGSTNKRSAMKAAEEYLDQLIEEHGVRDASGSVHSTPTLDPHAANDVKSSLDAGITYDRNPLKSQPGKEEAYSFLRKAISKKIDEGVDFLSKASGDGTALSELKQANKDYGNSKSIENMAADRMARENANRRFGLTDTIAGGSGAVAGSLAGEAIGDRSPYHRAEYGLGGLLLGAAANKLGRTYGPGIIAGSANALSRAAPLAGAVGPKGTVALQGLINRGLVAPPERLSPSSDKKKQMMISGEK